MKMPTRACDVFLIAVYVLERDSKLKLHIADISQWYHLITLSRLSVFLNLLSTLQDASTLQFSRHRKVTELRGLSTKFRIILSK
jgi:hypothetical protein